jgi:hypothetical protein
MNVSKLCHSFASHVQNSGLTLGLCAATDRHLESRKYKGMPRQDGLEKRGFGGTCFGYWQNCHHEVGQALC